METPERKNDQVVEKLSDKLLNPITEAQKVKGKLTQQFFQVALQRANIEIRYQEIFGKMKSNGESIGNKIKRAFDKMKLGKKKNYMWQYDGKGSFIGVPRPEPKKKVEK